MSDIQRPGDPDPLEATDVEPFLRRVPLVDFAAGRRLGVTEGRRIRRRDWVYLVMTTVGLAAATFGWGVLVGQGLPR